VDCSVIIAASPCRRPAAPAAPALLLAGLCLVAAPALQAQDTGEDTGEAGRLAVFPVASFRTAFQKYIPPAKNVYSPYYSWDAEMALDLTVLESGANALSFVAVFQTAGTENLGGQAGVGGTAYILGLAWHHEYSDDIQLSAGVSHLSSHLTRDLDAKTDEQRAKGAPIPEVADPDEYNVLYLRGLLRLRRWPFSPRIEAIVQPVNFRFDGGNAPGVRPIHLASSWRLWQGRGRSVRLATRHEFGTNPFNHFSLSLELLERGGAEGRLALFLAGAPGDGMHVSPQVGAVRDGISLGLRLRFRSAY
jgi:hypothetical protein